MLNFELYDYQLLRTMVVLAVVIFGLIVMLGKCTEELVAVFIMFFVLAVIFIPFTDPERETEVSSSVQESDDTALWLLLGQ